MNYLVRAAPVSLRGLLMVILLHAISSVALAEDVDDVFWPYFSYPPLFVVEEGSEPSGFCYDIQDIFIKHFPEFVHKRYLAAVSRMVRDVSKGKHVVMVGPVKGPGRDKIMTFSIPMRVSFLSQIIIRAEDFDKFGGGSDLSLIEMMKNPKLRFGKMGGAAHGVPNDAILKQFPNHNRTEIVYGANALHRLTKMLDLGRIDFFLWDPIVFVYTANKLGYEDRFMALPVSELETFYEAGYVVLPRNNWGREMVEKINTILKHEIRSGNMLEIQLRYIPESFRQQYIEAFNKLVAFPAGKN